MQAILCTCLFLSDADIYRAGNASQCAFRPMTVCTQQSLRPAFPEQSIVQSENNAASLRSDPHPS
jgi:hypothetical protein